MTCRDISAAVETGQAGAGGANARPGYLPGFEPPAPPDQSTGLLDSILASCSVRALISAQQKRDEITRDVDAVRWALSPKAQAFETDMEQMGRHFAGRSTVELLPIPGMGNAQQAVCLPLSGVSLTPPYTPPPTVIGGREHVFDMETGRTWRRGDADETPCPLPDETPDAEFVRRVERVFETICREQTGVIAGADYGDVTREERQTLKAQSRAIAEKLVASGREAYRNDMWNLWIYHLHTRHLEELPKFRRVCLLPYVAAMVRANHLKAVEHWLQHHEFCRFWTFTSGTRCTVKELRARLIELHGRISDLNAWLKARRYPVQIVFRSSELGTIESKRGDKAAGTLGRCPKTGAPLYHPHAHCVVWLPNGRLDGWQWSAMLSEIHSFWGDNWQDGDEKGGPIRNPKECVKYMLKPGELEQQTPEELGALHDALFRLKMVQPMGELARQIRARDKAGLILVKLPSENGEGMLWREIVDPNRGRPTDKTERMLAHAMRLDSQGAPFTCMIARLVPAFDALGVKAPRVIIATNCARPDIAAIEANPAVRRLTEQTRAEYAAAFIRVHKGTATVSTPFVMPVVAEELAKLSTAAPPDPVTILS